MGSVSSYKVNTAGPTTPCEVSSVLALLDNTSPPDFKQVIVFKNNTVYKQIFINTLLSSLANE